MLSSTGSVPHSPNIERKNSEATTVDPLSKTLEDTSAVTADDLKLAARRKSLQRSHTIGVGVSSRPPPNRALLKGMVKSKRGKFEEKSKIFFFK